MRSSIVKITPQGSNVGRQMIRNMRSSIVKITPQDSNVGRQMIRNIRLLEVMMKYALKIMRK
jgi:hypothetical protein